MNRMIYCLFLKKYSQGLSHPCFPGTLGKLIYNHISQEAWKQWQKKQTILINEKKLNMLNHKDQKVLEKEMKKFLFQHD